VLVCTTIVETGLDIANANTLIVEGADRLGLAQLHQLRGRVGRGRERAYSYFFYPRDIPLTETAHDRLATIAANTELGSGMAVALKDLEIRGAGNLLGAEQSGHIEGVGFDLYVRMVGEAVAAFKGELQGSAAGEAQTEARVELPVDAHLPTEYIDSERLRLEAYRKIAAADAAGLAEIRTELVDRYGPVPDEVDALFEVAAFRDRVRGVGLTEVTMQGKYLRLVGLTLPESTGLRMRRVFPGTVLKPAIRQILVPVPTTAAIGGEPIHGQALLTWANSVLDALAG
jgi:transcription-repair coupling factor (superfamily II helicase)